jgi:ribosomal protein S4
MRQVKKYKKYSKIRELSPYIPARISKFQRPKWKFFQKRLDSLKKSSDFFVNPLIKKSSNKSWEKTTDYFRDETLLKRFLVNSFDSSIKLSSFQKSVKPSSKKITKDLLLHYLVKPLYRVDILLSRFHLFSSSYQARQFISNGVVLVNGKQISGNFFLKKGDIVSFNSSKIHENLEFSTFFNNFLNNELFYSFVEIDYYTKTLIVLKDLKDLTLDDLNLLITDYFDIYKLK